MNVSKMGVLHIYVYLLTTNLIFLASGSKLKAMENLFRGEIFLLREEVNAVATNQEAMMKIVNETVDKVGELTYTQLSSSDQGKAAKISKRIVNENKDRTEELKNLSQELIRTRRGFHDEKAARKQDRESLMDVLENKIAVAMATKMDRVIEKVDTSNEMLQALDEKVGTVYDTLEALNGKVNGIEQRLNNLEMLHTNELNGKLDSINSVVEEKCASVVSNIQTDVKLFKALVVSILGRLFSRNHYPISAIQECLTEDAENIDDNNESTETCLAQNVQDLQIDNLLLPVICLAGGTMFRRGRIEVLYNGTYGTVCDDDWKDENSLVVCKMLGFTSGVSVFGTNMKERYGTGTGKILLDNVICTGEEKSLFDCQHNGIGIHNCGHDEDVAVECS